MLLLGSALDLRGQVVDVTATLDASTLSAGGSTVLRVFARVTPGLQANADRIFSWYVDVLNTNAATATVNFAAMQKPTSDQSPQTSSPGTPDGGSRRGIYDTFLNLPGAGVNAPVELMVIPVTALAPGQARFQIRPGTGANQSADFLVAPLGGGAALSGGNYALAEAVLSVGGTGIAIPLSITVTNVTGGAKSVTLSFPVTAGFNYTAQYRDQLNDATSWQPLPGAPHNSGRALDLTSAGRRFYRVAVTPAN
jgi:hypothetical protein